MKKHFRHLLFIGLSAGYAALLLADGSKFSFFSRRGGLLLFICCAWLFCYARGNRVKSDVEPYPYRLVLAWIGILGMIVCIVRRICFGQISP